MRPLTSLLAVALLLLAAVPLATPAPAATWQPGRNDYTIPVSDGATIDATMYVPDGTPPGARLPAIVAIHGYGGSKDTGTAREASQRGYVGFAYSTRGFGQSTGQMDVVGPRSIQDLKELVAWLKQNGPVDGARVGVTGASYGGGHSLLIATQPDAGVATVVPIVGWTDLGLALRPNDVFKWSYTTSFYAGGNGLVQNGNQPVPLSVAGLKLGRRQMYDTYDPDTHVGYASLTTTAGESSVEAAFRERSAVLGVENIRIPIYMIQGMSDDLFPADQALPFFQRIPTEEKRLHLGFIGHPRAAGGGPEVNWLRAEVHKWFDHYLKGVGPRPFDPARPIEVARTPWDGTVLRLGVNDWPGGATGQAYALNPDLSVGAVAGRGVAAISNTFVAGAPDDPVLGGGVRELQDLPPGTAADTLVFLSKNLTQPVELLGTPRVELSLKPAGAAYQVAVKVFDRGPAGSVLVTRGIWGVPDNVPVVPQRLVFDLQGYRYTFPAGHQVEVRIAASDFPAYLPTKAPFTLAFDLGEQGSVLRLPLSAPLP